MAIFHKATFTLYSENLRSQIRVHVISSLQDSIICLSLPRPPCLASARTPTWAVGFRPFRPNWKALLLTENASAQAWKAEMLQPRSQRSGGLGIRQQTIESWKDDIVFLRHDRKGDQGFVNMVAFFYIAYSQGITSRYNYLNENPCQAWHLPFPRVFLFNKEFL